MLSTDWSIFDGHCDTLDKLRHGGILDDATLQFNLQAARKYARYVQVMAEWMDPEREEDAFAFAEKGIGRLRVPDHQIIRTKEDLRRHTNGPGFLLGIEGGEAVSTVENITELFEKGVRLITLTWNGVNQISDTALDMRTPGGLTAFGREVVRKMEALGIAVDVSHISEKGFWDVLEVATAPIIASHSCAKALCDHPRNLTDAQFGAICKNDGMVGINFFPDFLGGDRMEDVLRHILHFLELGGEDCIGLGSDFDGIPAAPQGLSGTCDMYALLERMLQENIPESIVKKVAYTNMERYFLRILPHKF